MDYNNFKLSYQVGQRG